MRHRIWGSDQILGQELGKVNRSFLAKKEREREREISLQAWGCTGSAPVRASVALTFPQSKDSFLSPLESQHTAVTLTSDLTPQACIACPTVRQQPYHDWKDTKGDPASPTTARNKITDTQGSYSDKFIKTSCFQNQIKTTK